VSKISKGDADHFRAAMKDVRPIKADERHYESRPAVSPPRLKRTNLPVIASAGPGGNPAAVVADACEQNRPLAKTGVSRKALRALGQRQNPVADSFDLHGLNENQARAALEHFLAESLRDGLSCVRIVHGKGLRSQGPAVLRLMSWQLLWQHPEVLALKPCEPRDGGMGAVLVMLDPPRGDRA
jgi:DNA-nicking Smr family endonuclease